MKDSVYPPRHRAMTLYLCGCGNIEQTDRPRVWLRWTGPMCSKYEPSAWNSTSCLRSAAEERRINLAARPRSGFTSHTFPW